MEQQIMEDGAMATGRSEGDMGAGDGQMGDMGAAEFDVWETHVRDTEWRAEESR